MDDGGALPDVIEPSGIASSSAFSFSSFGVAIRIEANRRVHLDALRSRLDALLVGHVDPIGDRPVAHVFSMHAREDGALSLALDDEPIGDSTSEHVALQYLGARIKALIAETTPSHLLVHAGVVALGGRAIVMPAHSFQGKTTLVRELVARGAVYYSDDLAVFDHDGLVHPFPKTLSVRRVAGEYEQEEHTVESLGGTVGVVPLPVGLVLFTGFAPDAIWAPREISPGRAVLQLLEHTGSVRAQPLIAMEVLGKVVRRGAILLESPRRDAGEVADYIVVRSRAFAVEPATC